MVDGLPLVGCLRGYRWWRIGAAVELFSPWRGPIRWEPGENQAQCLGRRGLIGWKTSRAPHPAGCPALDCECGFYALHSIPRPNDRPGRSIWEIDALSSGGRHGLVLGVIEGYGRVLLGTAGWRARFAWIRALFAATDPAEPHRVPLAQVARRYDVPLYRDLEAMATEWGPDRGSVEQLIA